MNQAPPMDDMGGDLNMDLSNEPIDNQGQGSDEDTKEVQSLAGKLAQKIRDIGGLDDNMKKQVQGTVDSALGENTNLTENVNLDESFIESIVNELANERKNKRNIDLQKIYQTHLK